MKINVKLDENAIMPQKAYETDGGFDLLAPEDVDVSETRNEYINEPIMTNDGCVGFRPVSVINVGGVIIDTGVHMDIPAGYVGMIKSKSGLNIKHGIIADGVVDAGYVGSIKVKLYNLSNDTYHFNKGDKITQIVILPIPYVELEQVTELSETDRGEGGFGSTGR